MFKRFHKARFFAMSVIIIRDQAIGYLVKGILPRPTDDGSGVRDLGCHGLPSQVSYRAISRMWCFIFDDQIPETQVIWERVYQMFTWSRSSNISFGLRHRMPAIRR